MSESMRITARLFERVLNSVESDADVPRHIARKVLLSGLDSLGIEIEEPCLNCEPLIAGASATRVDGSKGIIPCNTCNAYVNVITNEFVWVERTWADVREGDVIRPAGQTDDTHAAIVVKIGPINRWHAAPGASQYRPNESPLEWSARAVTLAPILVNAGRASSVTHTPQHGMRPDAAVGIKVTRGELAAIEALGGWHNRIEAAQ